MIELTFLLELILIKQVHQKSAVFLTIGTFLKKGLSFNVCNRCHDLIMVSMNLSNIAMLNMKDVDYCCIISRISQSEAINLMENIDLTEKSGAL